MTMDGKLGLVERWELGYEHSAEDEGSPDEHVDLA